jgi:hypothetical protein
MKALVATMVALAQREEREGAGLNMGRLPGLATAHARLRSFLTASLNLY